MCVCMWDGNTGAIVSLSNRYSSSPAHVNDRTTLFTGGEERQYHADNRLSAVVLQICSPCRIEDLTYELRRNSIVTLRFSVIYSCPDSCNGNKR